MERLLSFAALKSEPALKTDNDKHILERAAANSTNVIVIDPTTETPREKSEEQRKDEELLSGTVHTVPSDLVPLVEDISNGLGLQRQVYQALL